MVNHFVGEFSPVIHVQLCRTVCVSVHCKGINCWLLARMESAYSLNEGCRRFWEKCSVSFTVIR